GRPLGGKDPPREQEEDGGEQGPRDRGGEAPGPWLIAEGPHPHRDEELGGGRVDPFRGRLALEVLLRGLRVVDLVEVLLGRVEESGQAEGGRGEQQEDRDLKVRSHSWDPTRPSPDGGR